MKTLNFFTVVAFLVLACSKSEPVILSKPGAGVTFDGYDYKTIIIGNGQEWMAENLRTTVYANGDSIPNVEDLEQWNDLTSGAWVHNSNNSSYENPYGKLYNWYAAVDPRNVCPPGWHIPSYDEWIEIISYFGGSDVAGGKLKSLSEWNLPNEGATNYSGFSGLPGGDRNLYEFLSVGKSGSWWSTKEDAEERVSYLKLEFYTARSKMYTRGKQSGISCRCVKD